MPLSSKFLPESTGERIVKIGQCLAEIWKKYNSLLFWPTLYNGCYISSIAMKQESSL